MKQVYDVIIIGGGIVGLATALELQNRNLDAAIAVLEKEPKLASHQFNLMMVQKIRKVM